MRRHASVALQQRGERAPPPPLVHQLPLPTRTPAHPSHLRTVRLGAPQAVVDMSKSGKGARRGGAAAAAPKLFDESLRNVQVGEQTLKTSILPDLVLLHALESPKKVFLEMWNPESNALTSITFGEFAQRVGAARARLEASGIAPGKRVGFLCQASVEYFVLVLAAMSAGATVVNLIWRQPVDNLMEMCRAVVLDDLIASPAYESESKQLESERSRLCNQVLSLSLLSTSFAEMYRDSTCSEFDDELVRLLESGVVMPQYSRDMLTSMHEKFMESVK